jgi:hypothetical protein
MISSSDPESALMESDAHADIPHHILLRRRQLSEASTDIENDSSTYVDNTTPENHSSHLTPHQIHTLSDATVIPTADNESRTFPSSASYNNPTRIITNHERWGRPGRVDYSSSSSSSSWQAARKLYESQTRKRGGYRSSGVSSDGKVLVDDIDGLRVQSQSSSVQEIDNNGIVNRRSTTVDAERDKMRKLLGTQGTHDGNIGNINPTHSKDGDNNYIGIHHSSISSSHLPSESFRASQSRHLSNLTTSEVELDTGDTAFMILAITLVMLQTPGIGLTQAGLIRRKNSISILLQVRGKS